MKYLEDKYPIGIDLGASKIEAGLVGIDGKVDVRIKMETRPHEGHQAIIERLAQLVKQIMTSSEKKVSGVGIGAPGQVSKTGVVLYAPNLKWKGVRLKSRLKSLLRCPVKIGNDVTCATLAELKFGVGRSLKNFISIFVGTGIGGGVVVDGKVVFGATNVAGEIGHMIIDQNGPKCTCGKRGCWEAIVSGPRIIEITKERVKERKDSKIYELVSGNLDLINVSILYNAFCIRDPLALDLINLFGDYLAVGVANLVNILNPEAVVFGGGVIEACPTLLNRVRDSLSYYAVQTSVEGVQILKTGLGSDCGIIGAGLLLMEGP
jgi:glucokinase